MKSFAIFALLATGLVVGCASFQPIERPPFNESEYMSLAKQGTGMVRGQVFLLTRGGDVKYGAGSEVSLNPVTTYSKFWFEEGYSKNRHMALAEPDNRQDKYIITTQADGGGNFEFTAVPAGRYYLTSAVHWETPTGMFSSIHHGDIIAKEIEVKDGDTVRVMLTK